jgi:ATP synthase protein I
MTTPPPEPPDGLVRSVHERADRRRRAEREGEPSFGRQLAQVGVLGWMVVTPALLLLFLGRWLDRWLGSGIFWSAPLLMLGVSLGCWTAWRWIRKGGR